MTMASPVSSQEGLLWGVHHLLNPLHRAAHAALGGARRQAPALHGSRSGAVRTPHHSPLGSFLRSQEARGTLQQRPTGEGTGRDGRTLPFL